MATADGRSLGEFGEVALNAAGGDKSAVAIQQRTVTLHLTFMTAINRKQHKLPSREVAYAYTVAMHFAQRFQQDLRAILYTRGYLEKGEELQLTPEEIWRFKRKEGFIDKPTYGAILKKLRRDGLIKGKTLQDVLEAFDNAWVHGNDLAHWFLAEQNFAKITPKREKEIIRELHRMTLDLYKACQISYALCHQGEYQADGHHQTDQQVLRKLMLEDAHEEILRQLMVDEVHRDKPNRRYGSRTKR